MPTEISNVPLTSAATTEVGRDTSTKRRQPILSESVRRPSVLIWVSLVPQIVLLLLNLRDYLLVVGEMTPWQRQMSLAIGAAEATLLVGVATLALFLKTTGRNISWGVAAPLLVAPILYLWFALYHLWAIVPRSVTVWILPPDQVIYDQLAFMMPLMFYAMVVLACADIRVTARREWTFTLSLAIGVPLLIAGSLAAPRSWQLFDLIPGVIAAVIFIGLGVVFFIGILRALVIGYIAVRRKGPLALGILSFAVGIAGPIGGLLLNRSIPFPADFQSASVYALALVNGLVLLLPNFRHPLVHRAVWLSQCLLFPFTLYFFVVFLPFLPFSLIGILFIGTGFLVLTPTALFMVHGQRIYDGYRNEIRDGGRLKPALLGLIALSIIPAYYAAQAAMDRVVLRTAIDYVYSPNYRTSTHFEGSPRFVQRSLENLRDSKVGLQLPFLSRFYNWVVFDGLVLPDDKMDHIHSALLGRKVEPVRSGNSRLFGRSWPAGRTVTTVPPADVLLKRTSSTVQTDGACHRAAVLIEMENPSGSVAEFATTIRIPDGVLVSGFWLHIGPERVPGRVFEKKTALWVYQMIRNRTTRDPGILLFTNPNTLDLRVYPFAARESRQVEIEFLYPSALNPSISVGKEILRPSGENKPGGVVVTESGNGATVWLSPDDVAALPKVQRTPYFHFIIDRSARSNVDTAALKRALDAARAQFPTATECLITAANFEIKDLTRELKSLEFATSVDLSALPARGGFMAGRAIKRELLRYHDALEDASAGSAWLSRFPIFVVVQGERAREIPEPDLSLFARFTPELPGYYVSSSMNALEYRALGGDNLATPTIQPVALLKLGNRIGPCPAGGDQAEVVDFSTNESGQELSAFESATNSFVRLNPSVKIPSGTQYAAGTAVWRNYMDSIYNPSVGAVGLGKIVEQSRDSGILVGATSYIVVENSAQWKMLERKQKQKLRNSSALEFEAVPEPSIWCLIIGGGVFLTFVLARKRRVAA